MWTYEEWLHLDEPTFLFKNQQKQDKSNLRKTGQGCEIKIESKNLHRMRKNFFFEDILWFSTGELKMTLMRVNKSSSWWTGIKKKEAVIAPNIDVLLKWIQALAVLCV